MSLRVRLIVAFFLLSVVPLAAVTFYTAYTNLQAVREAAGNEAELLAGELSQRMQVVTAQLSQRVEKLMTMSAEPAATSRTAPRTPARPAAASTASAQAPAAGAPGAALPAQAASGAGAPAASAANGGTAANAGGMATGDVKDALGELAMLINNVEIRGPRGGGRGGRVGGRGNGFPPNGRRGGPPPSPQGPAPDGQAAPSATPPSAAPGTPTQVPPTTTDPSRGATIIPGSGQPASGDPGRGFPNDRGGRFRGDRSGPPPDGQGGRSGFGGGPNGGFGGRGGPEAPPVEDDPTRIRIDMAPVWREVMQQFVPDGNLDALSPEERQRVFAEVNQRMLGIQQGIQILRERVAERVADVQQAQTPATASSAAAPSTASATATAAAGASGVRPPAPPTAPAAPVAPSAPAAPATASAPTRTTNITNGRLAVRVEQDGELLSQASAEINVPNLLATVFTTTRRERGEVPFAIGKDGKVETQTAADRQALDSIGLEALQADTPAGTSVRPGWIIATTNDPTGLQAKFGIARPLGEAVADLWRTTALNAGFGLGLIALALVGIVPLSSRLTRNLENLNRGVDRISQGDYGARVAVRSNDEVGRLADAFNRMAADVEKHQRSMVEQERLRRELELGRQIQHDMLPQVPLKLGLTEVKGVSVPAREVGGDFFNYFQLANGTLALVMGDVSGKGVGAALLMANIQASLRTRLSLGQDLAALARELDRDIEASTPGPVYATLFVGIFDPATRVLRCVNAGHNPQYVIRRAGTLERMEATGLPIGLLAGHGYTEQRVQLHTGDLLFFFTDGCVEAANSLGDMFGMERLETAIQAAVQTDDFLAAVEKDVTRFRSGIELSDDATMMVVRVG